MKKNKIVFFGNERLATGIETECLTLKKLLSNGYDVCAVVTSFEKATSRSPRKLEIKQVADKNNIPLLVPDNLEEVQEILRSYNADVGVLVAYGQKISNKIIEIFPEGIVNLHPSLLPKHRGPTPIESVILNGETETGVSIMRLISKMDSGPIYGYSQISLRGNETKQDLAQELLDLGSEMIINLLPNILDESAVAEPQDEKSASYDSQIIKKLGNLEFNKPATTLEREIRAYAGWPKSRMNLRDIEIIINQASVVEKTGLPGSYEIDNNELIVFCETDALSIESLQPAGKKQMTCKEFLAGYSPRLK